MMNRESTTARLSFPVSTRYLITHEKLIRQPQKVEPLIGADRRVPIIQIGSRYF